jgi:hypothetical protein
MERERNERSTSEGYQMSPFEHPCIDVWLKDERVFRYGFGGT